LTTRKTPYYETRPKSAGWLEKLILPLDRFFNRVYGAKYNPIYQSGTIASLFLMMTIATGLYQLIFYKLSAPYESVAGLEAQWYLGRWIRAVHSYAGDGLLLVLVFHVFRMIIQGKTYGPRLLAWLTGVLMIGIILISGWTGIVLVWDIQAQKIAMEGARLLDVMPIFSEPLMRAFTKPEGQPATFFFLNLLLHMVFPMVVLALFWVHTLRITKPALLPPKKTTMWIIVLMVGLGMVWPMGMLPKASQFASPDIVNVDLFYSWWIQAARFISSGWLLVLWAAMAVFMFSLPWWYRPKMHQLEASLPRMDLCTGCNQCKLDCPYGAINMIDPPMPRDDTEKVANVTPSYCTSCGICAGSCAPMIIGPPNRNGRNLLEEVREFQKEYQPGASDIVLIACEQGLAESLRKAAPEGVHHYPVHCIGALHTSQVEFLLRRGAGGVLMIGCPEKDCVYRLGTRWMKERLYDNREAELHERVDKSRVRITGLGRGELKEALEMVRQFKEDINSSKTPAKDIGDGEVNMECDTATGGPNA